MKGVVIAGTGSGVGKTSITSGILSRLSRDHKVQAYKVGPDFIDPMYHTAATGRRSRNLDSFFMSESTIKNLVGYSSKGADLCVVEGVRGLYEGSSGITDECSTAEMAKILGFPVILVLNARSLTRSAAAIINGFSSFDKDLEIKGVILNNVSGDAHERKLRDSIGMHTDVEIMGVVKRNTELTVKEIRLGLVTEDIRIRERMSAMEELVCDVDLDRILNAAETADHDIPYDIPYTERNGQFRAAVPMDDAFCFYYKENLECMEASGADIITFRPTEGDMLPDADVYYIGGGYPEMHAYEISQNMDFAEGLKNVSEEGRVVIGECGGMTVMCNSIMPLNGTAVPMAGIFNADSIMTYNRHGPSYVIAESDPRNPLFKGTVRGHEFHYSEVDNASECDFGFSIKRGEGIMNGRDGMMIRNSIGSYLHQHALSSHDWFGCISDRIK